MWHKTVRQKEQMGLDLSFVTASRLFPMFQLKLGYSRHYQINDCPGLLNAYRARGSFYFGKNILPVGPETCDSFAENVLSFLSDLLSAKERGMYGGQLFLNIYGSAAGRFMTVNGKEMDELLQLCDGHQVTIDDQLVNVTLDRKPLKATLRKKAYGATLFVNPMEKLCATDHWLYLYDEEGLCRLEAQGAAQQASLLNMLAWKEPLYVRESDISVVCR